MACSGCFDSRLSWVPPLRHSVVDSDPAAWELEGSGYDADPIQVQFCPFCGVRLDAEAPENGAIWGVQEFCEKLGLWYRVEHRAELHRRQLETNAKNAFEALIHARVSRFPSVQLEELLEQFVFVVRLVSLGSDVLTDEDCVKFAIRLAGELEAA